MLGFLPAWLGGAPRANIFWITPALAVGGDIMIQNPKRLAKLGIRAVLDVQAESADRGDALAGHALAYLKVGVNDFAAPEQQQLDEATVWVLERTQSDEPVFIHCRAGLGRSVTFALATLIRMGYDLPKAYHFVRNARAEIALSQSQLNALQLFAARLEQQ